MRQRDAEVVTDTPLWAILVAAMHPVAVAVASELEILSDLIEGALRPADLADRRSLTLHHAEVILEHMAALSLATVDAGNSFAATPTLRHLATARAPLAKSFRDATANSDLRGLLTTTLRTGRPAVAFAYGADPISDLERGNYVEPALDAFAAGVDVPRDGHVVDVGGGSGRVLAKVLACNPGARGTLLELPAVLPVTEKLLDGVAERERITLRGCDYTAGFPSDVHADVVILSQILVDLGAASRTALLNACRALLAPGGALVIHEMLAPDLPTDPTIAAMNTDMILWSDGKHLRRDELSALLGDSGYAMKACDPTWGMWSRATAVQSGDPQSS